MIPYGKQSISLSDIEAVADALKGDFLTTGPLVDRFQDSLSDFVGAPTIVVSSGTAALHAAYFAIGIQPGDEVITPPITFVATQATAALMGANIVFADVQRDTHNIDPMKVEELITSKTKAIVAVDYAGHPADLSELKKIAKNYGLFLIEDAAHSLGSTYRNQTVGSIADITTFSFFPTKNITTGEGGAVSSSNPELLNRARRFSKQGLVRDPKDFLISGEGSWHQEVHEFGLNYRLPDVLCALGLNQLQRIETFKARKREIHRVYTEALMNLEQLELPHEKSYVNSNWHLFPLLVSPTRRLEVFNALRAKGIGVQVNYLPAYRHPVFNQLGIDRRQFPNSEDFYSREISIPMYSELTDSQVEFIIHSICELF